MKTIYIILAALCFNNTLLRSQDSISICQIDTFHLILAYETGKQCYLDDMILKYQEFVKFDDKEITLKNYEKGVFHLLYIIGTNWKKLLECNIDINYDTASFSSRGINDGDYVVEERELDMAAAGVHVLGAYNDGCYAWYDGTSQASPHVAGMAAKLWQGDGFSTRTYLQNRARQYDLNGAGYDTETGFGLPIVP